MVSADFPVLLWSYLRSFLYYSPILILVFFLLQTFPPVTLRVEGDWRWFCSGQHRVRSLAPSHWIFPLPVSLCSLQSTPESRDKKSLSRARAILDPVNEALEKRSYSILAKSGSKRLHLVTLQDPQWSEGQQNQCVSLEDVKYAAELLLGENDSPGIQKRFQPMFRTRQLNEFLLALLNYFCVFLNPFGLDSKSKEFIPTGNVENMEGKMTLVQKQLARTYSSLLLGLGMVEQHHMACGKAMMSATDKDRQLFECLYTYCVYVIWVVYGRKHMDVIKVEVGRLLRSDIFNPAQRAKERPRGREDPQTEHRGCRLKRPPISSIVTQRSPALSSLLQTPKEKSRYLFQQHPVNPVFRAAREDEKTRVTGLSHCVGIIGEPLSRFLPDTLLPIETPLEENEEETAAEKKEGEDEVLLKSSLSLVGIKASSNGQESFHRHTMAISRATTAGTDSEHSLVHQPKERAPQSPARNPQPNSLHPIKIKLCGC
ncbi:protein phosphatase 1 regulatory subunit 36 isoform X2 [Narcine bancroftii]|uniref:protein phosphatase 1 regulatory subunit 36 isoform X2 n=1 Tax=Narcine bancroftii TaxID=1343680 RepID=UPI0038313033